MGKIRIERSNAWFGKYRNVELYLDGEKIGNIYNAEIKEFDVHPGNHTLIGKLDWIASEDVPLSVVGNETKNLKLALSNSNKFERFIRPISWVSIAVFFVLSKMYHVNYYFLVLPPFIFSIFTVKKLFTKRNNWINFIPA